MVFLFLMSLTKSKWKIWSFEEAILKMHFLWEQFWKCTFLRINFLRVSSIASLTVLGNFITFFGAKKILKVLLSFFRVKKFNFLKYNNFFRGGFFLFFRLGLGNAIGGSRRYYCLRKKRNNRETLEKHVTWHNHFVIAKFRIVKGFFFIYFFLSQQNTSSN